VVGPPLQQRDDESPNDSVSVEPGDVALRLMRIVAVRLRALSLIAVAVSVTVAGAGSIPGAVYVMAAPEALESADNVPHEAPEQPEPERLQKTPAPAGSFVTVAVNCCVPNGACTVAVLGDTATEMLDPGVTVNVVDPVIPPEAAWIVVVPAETAVATPLAAIVATDAFDELHAAVLVRF
jgi:hypothetical protein